ncbi:cation:proton antiporter [bacterium]|nr:cation:proton antiporter [bacterium]
MNHHDFNQIILILTLGVAAQWVAWRLRIPSILLLLASGLLIGPVLGVLDPDALLGDLLFPIVSISVAVILYEGGLSLRFKELPKLGTVVRNLVTVGALVTWIGAAAAARFLMDTSLSMSLLIGAILTVTGPTVVGPLLRAVRPKGEVGSVVKWEGILIDPIGAMLAVLVFEQMMAGSSGAGIAAPTMGLIRTIVFGSAAGFAGAAIMYLLVRYELVPDFLENSLSLGLVVAALLAADHFQPESGLLAVTLMGVLLANQKRVPVRRIVEFKENLRLLLISTLFILLSARMQRSEIFALNWMDGVFVAVLIFVIRPLAVWISTFGSRLNWREKLFLSWMAPRGIVAAAVSSVFAFALIDAGFEGAERLVPVIFLVIVSTVVVYGLTAIPVAKLLRISEADPQGILIIGAHGWARALAKQLQELGVRVLLVDRNPQNVQRAKRVDLEAIEGDVLTEPLAETLDLNGIGQLIALTANDEINTLACVRFSQIFGDRRVFQLVPVPSENSVRQQPEQREGFHGRWVFYEGCTFDMIAEGHATGSRFETETYESAQEYDDLLGAETKRHPLFIQRSSGVVLPVTCDDPPAHKDGEPLISLRVASHNHSA